ncbi:MAG: hypothetical protein A2Y17_00820 [Clostridiales bacterium GWF2_38_85]|nr:MAG: hypothetical protein A2Y17_00820 [Clostridiales bacterium GWF2_38_85]
MYNKDNNNFSLFGGFDRLINIISDMVDNDKKEVDIKGDIGPDSQRKVTGKYNFNIKLGPDSKESIEKIKAFDDIFNKKEDPGKTEELNVDIIEYEDKITIISELLGVNRENIQLSLSEKSIELSVLKNGVRYIKKIPLRFIPDPDKTVENFNNSIYSAIIYKII